LYKYGYAQVKLRKMRIKIYNNANNNHKKSLLLSHIHVRCDISANLDANIKTSLTSWFVAVNIRLYKYGYAQVKLRKMVWNNKEILLKINMQTESRLN
jgi:hypothetical protein